MGRLGFEPRTSRLKAECSTTELATPIFDTAERIWSVLTLPAYRHAVS